MRIVLCMHYATATSTAQDDPPDVKSCRLVQRMYSLFIALKVEGYRIVGTVVTEE